LAGKLIYNILVSSILPHAHPRTDPSHAPSPRFTPQQVDDSPHSHPKEGDDTRNTAAPPISEDAYSRHAVLLVALHLLNPIVIGISTRGSSESVLSLFVLLTLFCALRGWWGMAAGLLGVSAHWKIYPVIYGVSCVGVIATEHQRGGRKARARGVFPRTIQCIDVLVNAKTVKFAVISGGTFLILGALMYSV
jgi:GPI mannosyltransferase 1 subunit M